MESPYSQQLRNMSSDPILPGPGPSSRAPEVDDLMQTLENEEILRKFTGYRKQNTETRRLVLKIVGIIFIIVNLVGGSFYIGSLHGSDDSSNKDAAMSDDPSVSGTGNNVELIEPLWEEQEKYDPSKRNKRTTISPKLFPANQTEAHSTSQEVSPGASDINPKGSNNTGLPKPVRQPKFPEDRASIDPVSLLNIASSVVAEEDKAKYTPKPCKNLKNHPDGHKMVLRFKNETFVAYDTSSKKAKQYAARKAAEKFYNVDYTNSQFANLKEDQVKVIGFLHFCPAD